VIPEPDTCPLCGGTGWQTVARGKEREAVRCECRVKGRGDRLLAAANIPARYEHCDLSNFEYDPDARSQASIGDARMFAGRFVEEYPIEKTGILFVGTVGVGKTHLSVGILKALIREKGMHCLFCDYRELLKSIQNSYNASVQATEMQILRPVFDAEVLVLDELGAVRSTEWVFDTVNYILNSRYNENKTTIITTNFPDKPEQDKLEIDNLSNRSAADRPHAVRRWATASANECAHACTRCVRKSRSKARITANPPSARSSNASAHQIKSRCETVKAGIRTQRLRGKSLGSGDQILANADVQQPRYVRVLRRALPT
jgi:DNA replication protein DnaC